MSKIAQFTIAAIMAVSLCTTVQGAPLPLETAPKLLELEGTITAVEVPSVAGVPAYVYALNGPMRRRDLTTTTKQAQLERAIQNILASLPMRKRRDFWDTIGDAFEEAADTVGNGLEDAVDYVHNGVEDVKEDLANAIGNAAGASPEQIKDVVHSIPPFFGLGQGLRRRDFWDSVGDAFEEAADTVGNGLADAADYVKNAVDHDISLEFSNVGRRSFWDSIASVAEDAGNGLEDAADDVASAVTNAAGDATDGIVSAVGTVSDGVKEAQQAVGDEINEIPFDSLADIAEGLIGDE